MTRPTRVLRSVLPFPVRSTEPLEQRLLLATGPASMVKDINAVTASSDPFSFVAFKGATYFRANDGVHGVEWFRSDGTPGGTSMLADLNPGPASSFGGLGSGVAEREVATAAVLGDALLFTAAGPGGTGNELWKTDGTEAGTVLVKDISPNVFPFGSSSPQRFMVVGNTLYFTANDGTHGRQIWKTDGTADGTQQVSDIPNTNASMEPVPLGAVNGKLVFAARQVDPNGQSGRELYVTDGTPDGTTLLKNINPSGGSYPGLTGTGNPTVALVNNLLYFPAADNVHGRELWRTDGTPDGTVLVAELVPGTGSSSPVNLTAVNGNLYFTAQLPNSLAAGVYRIDPTGAISDISPQSQFGAGVSFPGSAGNVGGVFYLGAWFNNQVTLFKHDPATATANTDLTLVKQLAQATNSDPSTGPILDVGGKAVLLAQGPTGENSIRLWRSDGTTQGTVELASFEAPQLADLSKFARWNLARGANNLLYFAGNTLPGGTEPVRTDGTPAGTFGVGDLNANTLSSDPGQTVYLGGGKWVFTATDPEHGRELWVTNGTAAGTSLVNDIAAGPVGSFRGIPLQTPALNGRTYFSATSTAGTDNIDSELWTTDGTPQGTYRLRPSAANFNPRGFAALNGKMYFTAGSSDRGLWETDGTEAGTRLVRALDRVTFGPLVRNGNLLYFTTHRADEGTELWKTDGTADGTQLVSAISQDPTYTASTPVLMGGELYFTAPAGAGVFALWRSDGTSGGTSVAAELPGRFPKLVALDDTLLLSRGEQGQQVEPDIWVSDGTAGGTVPLESRVPELADFTADSLALGDPQLTRLGGAVYFLGIVGAGDPGVWRTDGTAGGTRLVRTFPRGARLQSAGVTDGRLYFSAGPQLWRTDGTESGTEMVFDGPAGSVGGGGGRVFFAGSDPAHGFELWALPREQTQVYVRNPAWAGPFVENLQDNGLGDLGYGYRVDDKGAEVVLPWLNLNQIVVRLAGDPGIFGVPTPSTVTIRSQRGSAYAVTRVDPVAGEPNAFLFTLDHALGGDGADASRNGDRLTLDIAGAGPLGATMMVPINVLQGDVNGDGKVLADDFSGVKKKFFKQTSSPITSTDADYSAYSDVDGSGFIIANDFSEVKKRFFQTLPAEPTASASASVVARRIRPITREWFAPGGLIG